MANKPTEITTLLAGDSHLGHLARMLRQQQALLNEVRARLPDPLAQHCLHARISGHRLILHVDSPVWGSQLRFHGHSLLRSLRSRAPGLRELSIRQLLPQAPANSGRTAKEAHRPACLADAVSDPELRALLKRRR